MKRVAFMMTHPTQYHAPWFRALAEEPAIDIHVFYGMIPDKEQQGTGFGVGFEWDVPLLEGYPFTVLRNTGTGILKDFRGVDTPEVEDIIRSRQFDAWVINGWRARCDWRAIRTCWSERMPMFIRGDSTLVDARPLHTRVAKRLLLGRWIPRFTGYLTVGTNNERFYEFYGASRDRFMPVRHFVDNEFFAQSSDRERERRAELRNQWGIAEDAIVFLFAGKLIPKKRPADVIEAFGRMTGQNRAHLLIVGDGELRSECERAARDAGIHVTFAGFMNQLRMPEAYGAADVLVLPSGYEETWGLVVNEAMASGLPAIVSDKVGCAPDLVKRGETGDVFPAGNIEALASSLDQYALNPSLARTQGIQARQLISQYSLSDATRNTVEAITRLGTLGRE